ncbi:MAG TPA: hypothetical protein VKE96_34395, partial [Vicinamibacterales bacterium]|nr:hypothetical protein [Vicinamibacterales bacterium]
RGLTGSWSKGRSDYYAYYHCRPGCRAVNVTKATLERLFADELALLQPTPGYMRLLKESVLQIWKARKAEVRDEIAQAERAARVIKGKLDRLDEAFLFERSIDIETYDRHAEKLREELTLARIDRHSGQLEELDVEGILAFAERVLPRAADLWVEASLDQRERFQQLFFPDGIAFDGNRFVGTGATAPAFRYLQEIAEPTYELPVEHRDLVDALGVHDSWNDRSDLRTVFVCGCAAFKQRDRICLIDRWLDGCGNADGHCRTCYEAVGSSRSAKPTPIAAPTTQHSGHTRIGRR